MAKRQFTVHGHVIDRHRGGGLPGLTVQAWDKDRLFSDLIGSAVTDDRGAFALEFDESHFREIFGHRSPDLFFKVFRGDRQVGSTEDSVLWNADRPTAIVIEIDAAGNDHRVHGIVRVSDGTPLGGAPVVAEDRGVQDDAVLGEAQTDSRGAYAIVYGSEQLGVRDKVVADLVVRVLDPRDRHPIVTSNVVFGAPADAAIDLEVPAERVPSEFERLRALVDSLRGGMAIEQLSDERVALVAGATGTDAGAIAALIRSERTARATGLHAALLYALLRRGVGVDEPSLLALGAAGIGRALDDALRDNLVPSELADQREELIDERVPALLAEALLRPAPKDEPASLGDILATVLPDESERRLVAARHVARAERPEGIGQAVRVIPELANRAADVEVALELADLTGRHLPMIRELQARVGGDRDALRSMAALERSDWEEVVRAAGAPAHAEGDTVDERVVAYATQLERAFEARFPTAAIASRIANGSFAVPDDARPDLSHFFERNPDFEFGAEPVAVFLADDGGAKLDGIKDVAGVRTELQRLERIVKVVPTDSTNGYGPRHRAASVLRARGFDSAQKIARIGRRDVVATLAGDLEGGEKEAEAIHARAAQTAAFAVALLVKYGAAFQGPPLAVLDEMTLDDAAVTASGVPDLRTLFGNLDYCACEHCQSIFSPAAYLVDLLQFLGDRALPGGGTVRDVLLSRPWRLDRIELTCENTNRRLPYIDLVNEILEYAIPLDGTPTLQTTWTEQELAAAPEHLRGAAYDELRKATFPWELPFDLWLGEVRAHLGVVGFSRHELMETLAPSARWTSTAIAHERLGISKAAADRILDTGPPAPWELWGLTEHVTNLRDRRDGTVVSGAWDAVLRSRVSILLQQSGLNYVELLAVLDTRYVNADGGSPMVRGDPCDVTKMSVPWLTPVALQRLHRFVRLWRILGWAVSDVDRALAAHGGDISDNTLVWLSHVERLRTGLRLPVWRVVGWWSSPDNKWSGLDTRVYADPESGASIPSPYDRVFGDPRVINPPDPALALSAARDELADPSATISAHSAVVAAGLGISGPDLRLLLAGEVADRLTLASLSRLYAVASLARALRLSISDFLRVRALCQLQPFPADNAFTPSMRAGATLAFVEEVDRIRASGFSLAELDYLLCHRQSSADPAGPSRDGLAATLLQIRDGLRRITAELQETDDERGEVTRRLLAQLGWPPELVEAATGDGVLGAEVRKAVPLAQLPAGVTFPADLPERLRGKVAFDAQAYELSCLGALRDDEREVLLSLPPNRTGPEYDTYAAAVVSLHARSRAGLADRTGFVARQMQSFVLPAFTAPLELSAPLAGLPAGVQFPHSLPAELRHRMSFDAGTQQLRVKGPLSTTQRERLLEFAPLDGQWKAALEALVLLMDIPVRLAARFMLNSATGDLRFLGVMTTAERDQLRELAAAQPYRAAIDVLFAAGQAHQEPDNRNRFLGEKDTNALFFDARSVRERYAAVQRQLLPYLRNRASEEQVSATLGEAVSLPPETMRDILTHRLLWPGRPARFALGAFLDPLFATSAATDLAAAFPDQLAALVRLHKLGLVVARLGIQPRELATLLGDDDWLWINQLPADASGVRLHYSGWRRLVELVALRDRLPAGSDVLAAVFAAADAAEDTPAGRAEVLGTIIDQLGWGFSDLAYVTAPARFMPQLADFREPGRLAELVSVFDTLRLIGASAEQAWAFAAESPTETDALVVRKVARATLGDAAWFERARALRDALRERQRAALVAYHVADQGLRSADELFGRYLIDVEMDPCALTSRIRQATGSVQLFVQRVLMGLEPAVPPWVIPADQWQWRKSYRVWEANLKVFIYPENWLNPELRDDKTPAFRQLEGALRQGDLAAEAAERAFATYLRQLEQVARLEITGAHPETLGNGGGEVLHVVARTFNTPHIYYYRRRTPAGAWTGWEPIDLDIQGDHVVPLVWKQRLFLFWAKLTEEAKEPETILPNTAKKPDYQWVLELAWSERTPDRWSASQTLTTVLGPAPQVTDFPGKMLLVPQVFPDILRVTIAAVYERGGVHSWSFAFLPGGQGQFIVQPHRPRGSAIIRDGQPAGTVLSSNALVEEPGSGQLPLEISFGERVPVPPAQRVVLKRQLTGDRNPFRLVFPLGPDILALFPPSKNEFPMLSPRSEVGFFFEDNRRSYHATHLASPAPGRLLFAPHFHPWAPELSTRLNTGGVRRLLSPETQRLADSGTVTLPTGETRTLAAGAAFFQNYAPTNAVDLERPPREDIDFDARGAYAPYNWELFFHAPLLIATRLSGNQRFAEAQQWFHHIFDPTDDSGDPSPGRFWHTRPFREVGRPQQIQELLEILADKENSSPARQELRALVLEWRNHPFRPHAVARWRTNAYQRAVVMAYVDNLIAWGDQLFRRDTAETVNEATQLYVLAASILGPRPERIPRLVQPKAETYATLQPKLDDLSNALVQLEGMLPPDVGPSNGGGPEALALRTLYFCVPHNPQLLERWDRVADRLFKIRHCMSIEGLYRELLLFDPQIDPGLLVQAAAVGVDLGAVLSDLDAGLPAHRFAVLAQKATELCSEVRSLGASLLSALERRDGEELARLRSTHEISVLDATRAVRQLQVEEAKAQSDTLTKSLELARARLDYYLELLSSVETISISRPGGTSLAERLGRALNDAASSLAEEADPARAVLQLAELVIPEIRGAVKELERTLSLPVEPAGPEERVSVPMSTFEKRQLEELKTANEKQQQAMDYEALAQVLAQIPDFSLGVEGWASTPVVQFELGGTLLSTHARLQASGLNAQASDLSSRANLHAILGGYQRRAGEWLHQSRQTLTEIEQIAKQMVAAGIRSTITAQELRAHDVQTANARAADALMREKFTNQELCDWLVGQISSVYLASYQLAYDVAKRAERAYRYELGIPDSSFIRFGYWDSLRKGLLAGERLFQDIKRMEVSYLERNEREHELTKHVSLAQLDPGALIRLKVTGACEIELPEAIFDLDRPGHYRRRIKTVSLSVPCVAGPYTGVHCTLTLLRSSERVSTSLDSGYPRATDPASGAAADDARFTDTVGALESIVTSSGQDQSGLFEANLRDERRLPFEGRGAISRWRLELPSAFRQFDYFTISDVVLHLRYTAREGGRRLGDAAVRALRELFRGTDGSPGLTRLFSLRHEFPGWSQLVATSGGRSLDVDIADRFPLLFRNRPITIVAVDLLVRGGQGLGAALPQLRRATLDGAALDLLAPWNGRDDLLSVHREGLTWDPAAHRPVLSFKDAATAAVSRVEDVWFVCHYKVDVR